MKKIIYLIVGASILSLLLACPKPQDSAKGMLKRNTTLYTAGGIWQTPSSWNPIVPWSATSGTGGLIYEVLFTWNPLTDSTSPWLAEKGTWLNDTTYVLSLRKGITWSDGKDLTAEDVKFTFSLAKHHKEIHYSNIWDWLQTITCIDSHTLRFTFNDPLYQEWLLQMTQTYILPKHIWEKRTKEELLTGANKNPIGSGCYLYDSFGPEKMVYSKNESWWGITQLNLNPKPKHLVLLNISSNSVTVGMLIKGELDFSNNFIPGIPNLKKKYHIKTWYDHEPYNLTDATCFLFINTQKKPFTDLAFRKAIAHCINKKQIVDRVYEGGTIPANAYGFVSNCKSQMKFYDSTIAFEYGLTFNLSKAIDLLNNAGYVDNNNDGYREAPDGSKIAITIQVPSGWSDWESAARILAAQLQKAGINCETKFPDESKWESDCWDSNFDLTIHNYNASPQPTVQFLYNWLLWETPEHNKAYNGNFGRYDTKALTPYRDNLARTKIDDRVKGKKIVDHLAHKILTDVPFIPVWNNGLWWQASEKYWTGWPDANNPYGVPCTYKGYWERGMISILSTIESKHK